jgi:glycosyltransferase involved in cell wall biosynthesis
MTELPTISVVTALYRSKDCIERLHRSLGLQNFRDFEWICVDDASPDDTVQRALELPSPGSFPTQLYRLPDNSGGPTALALGIERANGAIIVCIDHDDELLPDALQRIVDAWPGVAMDESLAGMMFRTRDSRSGALNGADIGDGVRFGTRWLVNRHPSSSDITPVYKADVLKRYAGLEQFEPIALWGAIHNEVSLGRDFLMAAGGALRIYHRDMRNSQTAFIRISRKTVYTYALMIDQWDRTYLLALPRWFRHAVSLLRFARAVHGSEQVGLGLVKGRWLRVLLLPLIPLARVVGWIKPKPTVVTYAYPDFAKLRALPDLRAKST